MRDLVLMILSGFLAVLLCFSHITGVQSQAYHFSNGWNPGKRASSPAFYLSADYADHTTEDQCRIRPQVEKLILDLLENKQFD